MFAVNEWGAVARVALESCAKHWFERQLPWSLQRSSSRTADRLFDLIVRHSNSAGTTLVVIQRAPLGCIRNATREGNDEPPTLPVPYNVLPSRSGGETGELKA